MMMYTAGTVIWLFSVILGSVHAQLTNSYYGIQITRQMVDIKDCGVKLNIYGGSLPGGTALKRFSCSTKNTGILYSTYGIVTFEVITPAQLYNPRNDFSIKVKAFQIHEALKDSVAQQNTNMDNLNETDDVNTRIGKLQQQIARNSARVAMTACLISHLFLSSGSVVKFDDIKTHTGISNLSSFRNSGKFTIEKEGLYLVSSWILSHTNRAQFAIYYNGKSLASAYVMYDGDAGTNVGTATAVVAVELKVGDTVWVQTKTRMMVGREGSCLTIAKLK
ncbi:uncharacterized protein LOC127724044 isoform X2 [Mytilus californianus]|uniref:uncharacterized protein LOC127724044 isoform X2 n=1 Tax=Mytilus californianus TaxID=6549 RepID=UPI0022464C77|nr:uncharacterized protein LOC127724044 isoform X2 [Mytilus californianus]